MTKAAPFLALLKFNLAINPLIWFMTFALVSPFLLGHAFLSTQHETLDSLLAGRNLFFVGIVGAWILAPEVLQRRWTTAAMMGIGTEFLLTRALDRRVLYRSRAVLLYLFVLLTPATMLLVSLKDPDLVVNEYQKEARTTALQTLPGSSLKADPSGGRSPLLVVPRGNILAGEWHLWMFVMAGLAAQLVLTLICRLKHRLAVFYTLFMGVSFLPLAFIFPNLRRHSIPLSEKLFFVFTAHPLPFLAATAALVIAAQLWCEARFIRQEY